MCSLFTNRLLSKIIIGIIIYYIIHTLHYIVIWRVYFCKTSKCVYIYIYIYKQFHTRVISVDVVLFLFVFNEYNIAAYFSSNLTCSLGIMPPFTHCQNIDKTNFFLSNDFLLIDLPPPPEAEKLLSI